VSVKSGNQGAVVFGGAAGNDERSRAECMPEHLEEFFRPGRMRDGKKA
jgi:hypothetical protein